MTTEEHHTMATARLSRAGSGAAPPAPAPIRDVTALLSDYFNRHSVVPVRDPWSRIMDGFLIQPHVYRWRGRLPLDAESWGYDPAEYSDDALDFGAINLLPPAISRTLDSLTTQARTIPARWGVDSVPWLKVIGRGVYVPASRVDAKGKTAVDRFKEDWDAIERTWNETIEGWIDTLDESRDYAVGVITRQARRAWNNAQASGLAQRSSWAGWRSESYYVELMVQRHMAGYPDAETIRKRNRIDYTVSFVPKPALELEDAREAERVAAAKEAQIAEQRRELELSKIADDLEKARLLDRLSVAEAAVQRKRELVEQATAKLAVDLDKRSKKAAAEFERAYAVALRQRLHESLALAIEGVRKGKLHAQVGRSLRGQLDELRVMLADGDLEMEQMIGQLDGMLSDNTGKTFTPAKVSQQIQDLGIVLQTSILALGEAPRVPKRMHGEPPMDVLAELPEDPAEFTSRVRAARERLHMTTSVGELALDNGLTPRRMRRNLAEAARPEAAE